MIFDGHADLLYDVTRRRLVGEKQTLERHHLDRLRKGAIEGVTLALWTRSEEEPFWAAYPRGKTDAGRTELMLACARDEFAECPWLEVVRTAAEAEAAKEKGKLYAFISVEGMAAMGEDPCWLDRYAEFGARMAMFTWNEENALATGAGGDPSKGLTELGKQTLRRMEALRIITDVSHLNDGGFRDVIRLSNGPVMASHSNCRALCDVRRNLTDEQLRAIRDTGGVVGVNVYHNFVHAERSKQTVEMLARHAARMIDIMGVEHVTCGFDFCEYFGPGNEGAKGMDDCSQSRNFFTCLEQMGLSERERNMIARENLLRLLR